MKKLFFLLFLGSLHFAHATSAQDALAQDALAHAAPDSLHDFLESERGKTKLPGVAAAVVKNGVLVASGAAGFRKEGAPEKVTLQDKWHIGSCTKAMTATVAARLIENGTLRWNMTLAEGFPALAPRMKSAWKNVTIEQLLSHRGGAPHEVQGLWQRATLPPRLQRAYLVEDLLTKQEPSYAPGSKFDYANSGYSLVGHLIEEKLNQPYEDVLRTWLFDPLKMTSAGFGMPATKGQIDQPWGHRLKQGKIEAVPPGPGDDNPAAIGPGGTVHCSIEDLAKFAALHLRGERENEQASERNGDKLLAPQSFQKLHAPFDKLSDYAMGWSAIQRDWGDGIVLTHNGTNTMNFAVIWLAPKRHFAVVVCTNIYGDGVDKMVDKIVWQLVQKYST